MIDVRANQVYMVSAYDKKNPSVPLTYVVVADDQADVYEYLQNTFKDFMILGVTSLNEIRETEKKIRSAIEQKPGSWPLLVARK